MIFERWFFRDRRMKPEGRRRPPVAAVALVVLTSSMVLGCTPTVETHGHSLEDAQITKIQPGTTSRQEVLQLMGSPSSLSAFDDDAWYYISQKTEKRSFYQKGVVDQEVLTIAFDETGTVTSVDRHGLDQMAAVDPVDRVTPTAGSSPSILKQLIGNIGRFSGASGGDSDAIPGR